LQTKHFETLAETLHAAVEEPRRPRSKPKKILVRHHGAQNELANPLITIIWRMGNEQLTKASGEEWKSLIRTRVEECRGKLRSLAR
jgi:hypothetical protein